MPLPPNPKEEVSLMRYVLTDGRRYLRYRDDLGRYDQTETRERADAFPLKTQARAALETLPTILRNRYYMVPAESGRGADSSRDKQCVIPTASSDDIICEVIGDAMESKEAFEWLEIAETGGWRTNREKAVERLSELSEQLGDLDRVRQEILHEIELREVISTGAAESFTKALHDVSRQRRKIKDAKATLSALLASDAGGDPTDAMIDRVRGKLGTRYYTYRRFDQIHCTLN